jgi:hypothetical protein
MAKLQTKRMGIPMRAFATCAVQATAVEEGTGPFGSVRFGPTGRSATRIRFRAVAM